MKHIIINAFDRLIEDIKNTKYVLLFLILYGIITQYIFDTVCPFRIVTGFLCPGCGLTHGCIYILIGKWGLVAKHNISAFLWVPFILYICIYRYILGKKPRHWEAYAIFICLITMGVYVTRILDFVR